MDERKITIIEGPPPTFEFSQEDWAYSLVEGPGLPRIAVTQVRALNGPSLVERCYRAWKEREPIHLEFRNSWGEIQRLPIVAAHYGRIEDTDVLRLWVAVNDTDVEIAYSTDEAEDEDDDFTEEDDELGFSSLFFPEDDLDDDEGDEDDFSDIDPNDDLTLNL